MDDLLVIVLQYFEKGSRERTINSLLAAGIKEQNIYFADREGVGSMSKAFNTAINHVLSTREFRAKYKYVWWVTNVHFDKDLPKALYNNLASDGNIAAVHPAHQSDHLHLRTGFTKEPKEIPFIELTAPMFNIEALGKVGNMDESMPYWGMDLDWSYRAKQAGYKLTVVPQRVEHVYLRFKIIDRKEEISQIREQLRRYHHKATEEALIKKYGENWRNVVWP